MHPEPIFTFRRYLLGSYSIKSMPGSEDAPHILNPPLGGCGVGGGSHTQPVVAACARKKSDRLREASAWDEPVNQVDTGAPGTASQASPPSLLPRALCHRPGTPGPQV